MDLLKDLIVAFLLAIVFIAVVGVFSGAVYQLLKPLNRAIAYEERVDRRKSTQPMAKCCHVLGARRHLGRVGRTRVKNSIVQQ